MLVEQVLNELSAESPRVLKGKFSGTVLKSDTIKTSILELFRKDHLLKIMLVHEICVNTSDFEASTKSHLPQGSQALSDQAPSSKYTI